MALNLDKIIKAQQFRFETKAVGELICNNFTALAMDEASEWLSDEQKKDSVGFTRYLTTLLCQPVDKEKEKGYRINKEQAELLTLSELSNFSRLFIERNSYLLEDQDRQDTIRKKDNEGKIVVSFTKHTSDELLKNTDESGTDHLLRVVDIYITQSNQRTKKLFERATKGLFSNTTLDLLGENKRISNRLGSSLINHEPAKLPKFPENPVLETNRQLASFGKELNEVAVLIKNMNDLGVQMAMDSAVTTARTKIWNNVMFGLGLFTLFVTAIFSYLSYSSSNSSSNKIEGILVEQNTLLKSQEINQKELLKAVSSSNKIESILTEQNVVLKTQEENQRELIDAISSIVPVFDKYVGQSLSHKKILDRISEQLNNITNQSSSQPLTARTPKSGASD